MELLADSVEVAGLHGPLLLPTTVHAAPRHPVLVAADPGPGPVALALALAGRVRLAGGTVRLDRDPSASLRRRAVALVDVPDVTAPEDSVGLRSAVAEQLALAGLPASRAATRAFLAGHGAADLARERVEAVPPGVRTALLLEVAARRAATRVVVVGEPDRHGGDPTPWWSAVQRHAADGLTVVVLCRAATIAQLGQPVGPAIGTAGVAA